MKKKLLSAILYLVMVASLVVGCGKVQAEEASVANDEKKSATIAVAFDVVETDYYYIDVYREVYTDVMYMESAYEHGIGLTVMLDPATGLPLTYTNYVENYYQK